MSALLDAILLAAKEHGRAIALDGGTHCLRYDELPVAVADMATMIADEIGPHAGPVGLLLDNGIDWVLADLALLKLGRASVPLPPFFTESQRASALADAGAVALIGPAGIVPLDHQPAAIPEGTAKISYTSGSTGSPKGICLSEAQMLATAKAVIDRVGRDQAGVHLPLLPLGVLLENVAGLYATLIAGGCYHVRPLGELGMASLFNPSEDRMIDAVAASGATSLILVPELLARIVSGLRRTGRRLPALRLVAVGGAHIAPALLGEAAQLGLPVVQGYGLTECGSVVALEEFAESERGTVGRPLGHVRVSLADDGEIIIDGSLCLGQVGAVRSPGPLHSGDIGRIDARGRLSVTGRKSNLIVTGFGRNISPEWIETALVAEPAIAQAIVTGDGEAALSALIVPSSLAADVGSAVARANAGLPEYARIGAWRVTRPFLPADGTLTANGRPRRAQILAREQAMPFFDRLGFATFAARGRLFETPQIQAGLAGRIGRETYLAYLAQAYHHVRHTVPLMRLTRSRLTDKPRLVAALDDYIAEEEGHEAWILADIDAAGGDSHAAVTRGPSPATAAMVDHAYRTIGEGNAAAFFGMVYVLEGTSILLAQAGADALASSLGLPPEAFTYLTSHGALDQDHMRFFETLVNDLDDADDEAAIIAMANAMFDLFGGVFAAIPMEENLAAA